MIQRYLSAALIAASFLSIGLSAGEGEARALARLRAAVQAALREDPRLHSRAADITLDAIAIDESRAVFEPYLEYQREGVSSSFSNLLNAQATLRIGTPFKTPWAWRASRAAGVRAESWATAARETARWETMADVTGTWLQLAALEQTLQIQNAQLERLGRAVVIERRRFEVGEGAEIELIQLELQEARLAAGLAAATADRDAQVAELTSRAGIAAPLPQPGDLQELLDDLGNRSTGESVVSHPALVENREKESLLDVLGTLERQTAWGHPEFQLEWERFPDLPGTESYDAYGLLLRVPLRFGSKGRVVERRTAAEVEALGAQRIEMEQELEKRLAIARDGLARARSRLAALAAISHRLGRTEFSLQEQFRLGAISYLRLLDGLERIDAVRLEEVAATYDLLARTFEIAIATGDRACFGADLR